MDVDHPLITGGGYDHESVALVGLKTWMNLGKSCEEHRPLAFEADEVRLFLFWVCRILYPFKPAICRCKSTAIRPKLLKKFACHDGFDSRIYRCGTFTLCPERSPSPANLVDTEPGVSRSNGLYSNRRRDVIPLYRQKVIAIDH